jgi:succinate dehydrogenase/fumarate reductase cytochrome b subunit
MEKSPGLPPLEDEEMGVMGLTQVDPSPVEDTPAEFKENSYFPDQERPEKETEEMRGIRRMNTLGLRLGDHGTAWWLLRIQKYSSYTFTAFAALHLTNVSIIPLATRSVLESNRYLLLTRPYYQSALTEPLLVALPLVAHVTSGIALRLWRRRQALQRYGAETRTDKRTIPWPQLSGTSALGYALVPLASFHVWTTRILPLYAHGDSSLINLQYISHGFALHRVVSYTGFTALVGVGVWHFVWGAAKWLGFAPSQVSNTEENRALARKRRWYTINGISAALTALWLAGGLGVVARDGKMVGWVGKEYDELYKYLPIIGRRVAQ